MDEHLIFFIDIVGFADAVRTWDVNKMASLISLLRDFASFRSEFDLTTTSAGSGQTQILIRPAATTFSDHIVISYPTAQLEQVLPGGGVQMGLRMAQDYIGALAAGTVNLGLLLRGGITVGPLYHLNGVVLGPAMNEAYELESRVSIYPRLAISRKVYSQTVNGPVLKDADGITHLDYFKDMILKGAGPAGSGWASRLKDRLAQTQGIITENISTFEAEENWNRLAKWVWFKNRLEAARGELPNELFT